MPAITSEVQHLLRPGERLLWTGRPDPRVVFTRADAMLIPFSILFFGFSIFWESSALIRPSSSPLFTVVGGFFVIIGCYLFIGRFVYKAWDKTRTTYLVTDARVLAVTGSTVKETAVTTQPLQWRKSRTHLTAIFGSSGTSGLDLENTGWIGFRKGAAAVSFFDVADAAGLRAAVDDARRRADRPTR